MKIIMHKLKILSKRPLPLFKTFKKGGKIMICGNGGSASDANHFAAELSGKFKSKKELCFHVYP